MTIACPGATPTWIVIAGRFYGLSRLEDGAGGEAVYRLTSPDGETYDVSTHAGWMECSCGDFEFRRRQIDPAGCKHCLALVRSGIVR